MSHGLSLPKRYRHVQTTIILKPTPQEIETMAPELTAQEFEGGMSEQGDLPYLSPTP